MKRKTRMIKWLESLGAFAPEPPVVFVIRSGVSLTMFLPLGGKVRMRGKLEQVKLGFLPFRVAQLIPSPRGEGLIKNPTCSTFRMSN